MTTDYKLKADLDRCKNLLKEIEETCVILHQQSWAVRRQDAEARLMIIKQKINEFISPPNPKHRPF